MGCKKNKKELLLTSIYQNAKTGLQSIDNITPSIKYNALIKELKKQSDDYMLIKSECQKLAIESGYELKDNNFFEKARLWGSIKMSTLTNNSTRHIAEMMLLGTFMGIVQCLKDFIDYGNCDEKVIKLLQKLQGLEESNLEELKKFL